MNYDGGKGRAGEWQRLINEIPPHDEYIEPFLGGGAIASRIRPAARMVGIDTDRQTIDAYRKSHPASPIELYCCDGIEWLKHRFGIYRTDTCVRSAEEVLAAFYRDARVPVPFVYIDPPYLLDTRRSGRKCYRHELGDDRHAEILWLVTRLPALVMIQHYPNDLYDSVLKGWRTFTYRAMTRTGMATEQVWCNYAKPQRLHDPRFVGRDRRERERIRRRTASWRGLVSRMTPGERQQVTAELLETTPAPAMTVSGVVCARCRTTRPRDVQRCHVCASPTSALVLERVFQPDEPQSRPAKRKKVRR